MKKICFYQIDDREYNSIELSKASISKLAEHNHAEYRFISKHPETKSTLPDNITAYFSKWYIARELLNEFDVIVYFDTDVINTEVYKIDQYPNHKEIYLTSCSYMIVSGHFCITAGDHGIRFLDNVIKTLETAELDDMFFMNRYNRKAGIYDEYGPLYTLIHDLDNVLPYVEFLKPREYLSILQYELFGTSDYNVEYDATD